MSIRGSLAHLECDGYRLARLAIDLLAVGINRHVALRVGLQAYADAVLAWLEQHAHLPILVRPRTLVMREKKIAAFPDPSLVYPHYYITRGAYQAGADKLAKNEIWRLRSQFKFIGHSEGSLWPRSDARYDRIEKPADLIPDQELRVEGKVLDAEGKEVAGAEVILATPVDDAIAYKSYDMTIVEGRIQNRLDHIVTDSDTAGRFVFYPPKDGHYYVVALHPVAGFHVAAGKEFADRPTMRLIPWASLVVEIDEEAGTRQTVAIRTRVPADPEVIVSQEPRQRKKGTFGFKHIPAIWDTAISRSFPDAQGVSIDLPGASVQLLAAETRQINLGTLTQQQRELLEERRREVGRR